MIFRLGYIGNVSMNNMVEVVDQDTVKMCVTYINQHIRVGKETRRPVPLPDWWID